MAAPKGPRNKWTVIAQTSDSGKYLALYFELCAAANEGTGEFDQPIPGARFRVDFTAEDGGDWRQAGVDFQCAFVAKPLVTALGKLVKENARTPRVVVETLGAALVERTDRDTLTPSTCVLPPSPRMIAELLAQYAPQTPAIEAA